MTEYQHQQHGKAYLEYSFVAFLVLKLRMNRYYLHTYTRLKVPAFMSSSLGYAGLRLHHRVYSQVSAYLIWCCRKVIQDGISVKLR